MLEMFARMAWLESHGQRFAWGCSYGKLWKLKMLRFFHPHRRLQCFFFVTTEVEYIYIYSLDCAPRFTLELQTHGIKYCKFKAEKTSATPGWFQRHHFQYAHLVKPILGDCLALSAKKEAENCREIFQSRGKSSKIFSWVILFGENRSGKPKNEKWNSEKVVSLREKVAYEFSVCFWKRKLNNVARLFFCSVVVPLSSLQHVLRTWRCPGFHVSHPMICQVCFRSHWQRRRFVVGQLLHISVFQLEKLFI